MPFKRPPLQKILDRSSSDFEFELGSQAARLPGTPERGFVRAGGGASHGLHGHLDWIATNAFPQTAEDAYLVRIAGFFNVHQKPAERATGKTYFVKGSGDPTIPVGTRWTRDDGVQYETTAVSTFGVEAAIHVASRAVEPGAAGNAGVTVSGTLLTPIAGVHSKVFVSAENLVGFTGGVDAESYNELRTRLLERLANPPNGGGPGSYVAWAKLVAGVTRVWEFGKIDENGDPKLGWVTVLFMRDNDDDPFPSDPEIATVKAKLLEYAPLHLLGLHVDKPIEKTLTLTIEITPDTADLRAAVVTAIQNMLAVEADPPPADGATFYKSKIAEAIGDVDGIEDYKLTVPAGDITVDQFELLTVEAGDVTWV